MWTNNVRALVREKHGALCVFPDQIKQHKCICSVACAQEQRAATMCIIHRHAYMPTHQPTDYSIAKHQPLLAGTFSLGYGAEAALGLSCSSSRE